MRAYKSTYVVHTPLNTIETDSWQEVLRLTAVYPMATYYKKSITNQGKGKTSYNGDIGFAWYNIIIDEEFKTSGVYVAICVDDIDGIVYTKYTFIGLVTDITLPPGEYTRIGNTILHKNTKIFSKSRQHRMCVALSMALSAIGDFVDVLICVDNISMLCSCRYTGNHPILKSLSTKVSQRTGRVLFKVRRLQYVNANDILSLSNYNA